MKNPKVDACLYLITICLQQMEEEKPGIIKDIIGGVKSDQGAISKNVSDKKHINDIFKETLSLLEQANNA